MGYILGFEDNTTAISVVPKRTMCFSHIGRNFFFFVNFSLGRSFISAQQSLYVKIKTVVRLVIKYFPILVSERLSTKCSMTSMNNYHNLY